MGKRAIESPEDAFAVAGTNGVAGAQKDVARFSTVGATVQAAVSSGSYLLEASIDGDNWNDIGGGAITGDDFITISIQVRFLRIFTTTAGDGVFTLFAHEEIY